MRTFFLLIAVGAVLCCVAAEKPAEGRFGVLPAVLTRQEIGAKGTIYELHKLKFNGREYLVADAHLGDGVAYKHIGIYTPQDDNTFQLSLFAESWNAFSFKISLDGKTGILELREADNGELKGELLLSCNLKTIGTPMSPKSNVSKPR